jgi:hypothetical protein
MTTIDPTAQDECWICHRTDVWTDYDKCCEECLSKVSDFMRSF